MISVTFTPYKFRSGEHDLLLLQHLGEKADKTTVYPSKGLGMAVKGTPWGADGQIIKKEEERIEDYKFMIKELVAKRIKKNQ